MRLIIQIDIDNEIFVPSPDLEVRRILTEQVLGVDIDENTHIRLRDINGSVVGQVFTDIFPRG